MSSSGIVMNYQMRFQQEVKQDCCQANKSRFTRRMSETEKTNDVSQFYHRLLSYLLVIGLTHHKCYFLSNLLPDQQLFAFGFLKHFLVKITITDSPNLFNPCISIDVCQTASSFCSPC